MQITGKIQHSTPRRNEMGTFGISGCLIEQLEFFVHVRDKLRVCSDISLISVDVAEINAKSFWFIST